MRGGAKIISTNTKTLVITVISVVVLDLVTKALIANYLYHGQVIEVVPGAFNIVYFKNPGAAFGIFRDGGLLRRLFLAGTSIAALVVIEFLLRSAKGFLLALGLSLIAGGALGNLVDRVRFGMVVDFLDVHVGQYHWPAFNVADSAITIGVLLAVFSHYFRSEKN